MMTLTPTDYAGPGSGLTGLQLGSGCTDRAAGPPPSLTGCAGLDWRHTSFRDRAEFSTVQEEIANLKEILSKYVLGRRRRRRENGR
jgi:hypothetical protein